MNRIVKPVNIRAVGLAAGIGLSALVIGPRGPADAGVPQSLSFQGRLTDAGGNPITATQSITFSFWDSASGGTQLWTETQSVQVSTGIYTVALGQSTPISTAAFAAADRWLQVKVGSDAAMTPRLKIQTVAYALVAERANAASGLEAASGFGVAIATNLVVGTGLGASTFTAAGSLRLPGSVTAGSFVGDGSGLTNVGAASAGQAILASTQTFSGQNRFFNQVTVASSVYISAGALDIAGISGATAPPSVTARMYYDGNLGKLRVSENGSPFYPLGHSFEFPDGLTNITPVTVNVRSGAGYTVPAGKNLYILTGGPVDSGKITIDGIETYSAGRGFETRPSMFVGIVDTMKLSNGTIVGAGSVIASNLATGTNISGFLVNQIVAPIRLVLNPATYTVPAGFNLFMLGIWINKPIGYLPGPNEHQIAIDGITVVFPFSANKAFGLVAGAGQVVSAPLPNTDIDGYLMPR